MNCGATNARLPAWTESMPFSPRSSVHPNRHRRLRNFSLDQNITLRLCFGCWHTPTLRLVPPHLRSRALELMSKSRSKRIRVKILNPLPGQQPNCSLERAWRYVRQKAAEWTDATLTVIRMICVIPPKLAAQVTESIHGYDPLLHPAVCLSGKIPWERDLSGSFLRYPLRSQVSGESYPALARQGAGLL